MKFSIETITQIQNLIVADFKQQMETEETNASSVEQALRNLLQTIGCASYGGTLKPDG